MRQTSHLRTLINSLKLASQHIILASLYLSYHSSFLIPLISPFLPCISDPFPAFLYLSYDSSFLISLMWSLLSYISHVILASLYLSYNASFLMWRGVLSFQEDSLLSHQNILQLSKILGNKRRNLWKVPGGLTVSNVCRQKKAKVW